MRIRKLKAIAATVVILLVIGIIKDGRANFPVVNRIILTILSPVNFVLNSLGSGVQNTKTYFTFRKDLVEKNTQLQKENDNLRQENADLIAMKAENERLTQLLKFKNLHPNLEFTAAKVISRDMGDFKDTVLIDKGEEDGLKLNMSVINGSGLIGIVDGLYPHMAKILLVNSPKSRLGGMNLRGDSRVAGIVSGVAGTDASLEMRNMARNADLLPGDTIVTNGYSGYHPSGLIIGTIEEVQMDPGGLTKVATITPAVDFTHLEEVMVITNFQGFAETLKNSKSKQVGQKTKGGAKQ